jgi:hypothetical protein
MLAVATLYVRNLPPKLYAELQRWAADAGRSVNGEVLALLEREALRRRDHAEFERKLAELGRRFKPLKGSPKPEDLIREDRDRGHKPELGY